VKQNGRWYFSIAYTALEYWRMSQHLPEADFGAALKAPGSGASTPEAAVTKMIDAVSSIGNPSDLDKIFELVPPGELGALYDYRNAIHQAIENGDVDFPGQLYTVTGTPTFDTAAGDGDVRVFAKHVAVHYKTTDDAGETTEGDVTVDRHCVTATGSDDSSPQCLTDNSIATDLGVTDIFVSVVEEHGRWYVSPMSTLGDYASIVISHLDHDTVDKLRRDFESGFQSGDPPRPSASAAAEP